MLDRIDHVASDILLPASAIAIALLVGWAWSSIPARRAAGLGESAGGTIWHWWMRIVVPLAIAIVMIRGLR
ncbi:MAG: hypothetical protein EHM59_07790 [Betaproteobacteria bacterium]|nr:MAG: hypothetical protein EHM59_07790 [Betaproteobacteria bacterium]